MATNAPGGSASERLAAEAAATHTWSGRDETKRCIHCGVVIKKGGARWKPRPGLAWQKFPMPRCVSVAWEAERSQSTRRAAPPQESGTAEPEDPPHPPLPLTVGCFIFRVDKQGLARGSDVLKAWHVAASREWSTRYGFVPLHWETLVDPAEVESEVAGACFRRAGYRRLGPTTGRGARRPAGSTHGAREWGDTPIRQVFYRGPLHRLAAPPPSAGMPVTKEPTNG